MSRANAGLIRRDLARCPVRCLSALPAAELLAVCGRAAELFVSAPLPSGTGGEPQSPEQYVRCVSAATGLAHSAVRRSMEKLRHVLEQMPEILRGLMRGLEAGILDTGTGEQAGVPVCYSRSAGSLAVVLPSNSPGVNSLWLPAVPLKVPVALRPGRHDPFTPWRLTRALVAAGCPAEAFAFYPSDHQGGEALLAGCDRALLFGDDAVASRFGGRPEIQVHGPGRSKIVIGPDCAADWPRWLDLVAESIAGNGGRACLNASTVLVPSRAGEFGRALAERLAALRPLPPEDPEACLAALPDPELARALDAEIDRALAAGGAEELTAAFRRGPRRVNRGGRDYLLPTLVRCDSMEHPLARAEYPFPFAALVEVEPELLPGCLGPSLVVTAITGDRDLLARMLESSHLDRLNVGPVPTTRVRWDQPHEGNLFEFLYRRRALQVAGPEEWGSLPAAQAPGEAALAAAGAGSG